VIALNLLASEVFGVIQWEDNPSRGEDLTN
jgi:hypothetical protein